MRKGFLLLFFRVVLCLPALGDGFYGVHSPNGIDVWAAGRAGNLFRSQDGGITWSSVPLTTNTFRSLFTRGASIWLVGDQGILTHSSNSGGNWDSQVINNGATLRGVCFVSSEVGFAVGDSGSILRTTNGGSAWTPQASNTTRQLNAVAFADPSTGYAAGAQGVLLKTTNGGSTWTSIAGAGWTKEILGVSVAGQAVYVSGVDGFCAKSGNAGSQWSLLNFKTDSRVDVNGLCVRSVDSVSFVGGGGFIRTTSDGGGSFGYGVHQLHAKLNAVFFYDANNGWACGEKTNVVLRTTNGGASWLLPQGTTVNYQWQQKFSGSSIGNTFMINPWNKDNIYVVMSSAVYMSGDRGESWSQTASISTGGSTWSFYVSPKDTNRWLAATSGGGKGVRRSTDRGRTWTTTLLRNFTSYGMPLEMDPDHPDTVIFAAEGTSSGPDGILYISKDFGATWDTLARTRFRSPCDVLIVPDSTNIWYVADGVTGSGQAQMWRSTNYGLDWTSIYTVSGSEIPMISLSRLRKSEAYATAWGSGGYWKTSNLGVGWTPVAATGSTWGTDVAKDDPNVVIYGTYGGSTSYLSTNAGTSFQSNSLTGANSAMLAYDRATILAQQTSGVYKFNITYTVPVNNLQVLSLVSPSGGENWAYNTAHNVTWNANNIANVKLEYKTGPSAPWQTIVASTPASTGSFSWVVPNAPTTQARVRVSDASDSNPVDSSRSDFTISVAGIAAQPGSLAFGDVRVGTTRRDTLRIANTGNGILVVSSVTTGGSSFSPGRTSFSIPPGGSDTLSVSFTPGAVRTYGDTLRLFCNAITSPFLVPLSGNGAPVPTVVVTAPNGGEQWQVNSIHNVTWTSALVDTVNIFYKPVAGVRWLSIASNRPAASGSYAWVVPNNPTPEALVRIVSSSDASVIDESNAPFAINPTTSVEEGPMPTEYALKQNYPNPFNPSTKISYALPKEGHVSLVVYNELGQEVVTLVNEVEQPGRYTVQFAAVGSDGVGLASGLYFYRLKAGEFTDIKRMLIIK